MIIEGAAGEGDAFMLGITGPQALPNAILTAIHARNDEIAATLGPVRFEWVHDGQRLWIVQLHRGATDSQGLVIVPGDAERWVKFDVAEGLEALRLLAAEILPGSGIELVGEVGLTSHIADLMRRAGTPARLQRLAGA